MSPQGRTYGGLSAAQRVRDRRVLLVDAVLDTVAEHGVSGTTVEAVCRAAGLTKRYFYESFVDLDAALVAAMDDASTRLQAQMRLAIAGLDAPGSRARRVVEVLIETMSRDPRLARLYVEAPGHAGLRGRRADAIDEFSKVLGVEDPSDAPGAPTGSAPLALRLVVAGTTELLTGWLSGTVVADRDALVDAIVSLGLHALAIDRQDARLTDRQGRRHPSGT